MTRSPLFLAALASSAVPGLDPVSVRGVAARTDDRFEVAHVRDRQDREWVVKVPRTPGAGAQLDDVVGLSALLARRLDLAVPAYQGHAPVAEGRAAVYPRVEGRPLDFAALPPGPLAEAVGRALAHVHNLEHLLYEEAGRPTYDAETHRRRRLSDLDRAAATGHVPTGLLTRWEGLLEDVSLWRFAPTAVHGTFVGANVLATFDDEDDASSGRVVGLLAWEESRVGDPADDFADLVATLDPDTFDAVLGAYARSRVERPDGHLVRRARLAAEMAVLSTLLQASAEGRTRAVERTAAHLRELDERTEDLDAEYAREDAVRSERTRTAHPGEGTDGLDPDDPDDPEQPPPSHDVPTADVPFPMLAETQAVPMAALLRDDPEPASGAPAGTGTVEPDEATPQRSSHRQAETVLIDPAVHATPPVDGHLETPQAAADAGLQDEPRAPDGADAPPRDGGVRPEPVPYLDATDSSAFEIDEVEALPEPSPDVRRGG